MKHHVIIISGGIIKSLIIEAESLTSAEEYIKKSEQTYFFPEIHLDNLVSYLKRYISLLSPTSPNCGKNWNCIIHIFKKYNLFEKVLVDYIIACDNPSHLFEWIKIIKSYNVDNYKFIQERIDKIRISNNVILNDMSNEILKDAEKSLQPNPRSKEKFLTQVNLNDGLCSEIVQSLGKKFELSKMISTSKLEKESDSFTVHNIVLGYLQSIGFPRIGLQGQSYLTQANLSKSVIDKIIPSINCQALSLSLQQYDICSELVSVFQLDHKKPKDLQRMSKLLLECLLTKNDYIQMQGSKDLLIKQREKSSLQLDEWQKEMIKYIQEGKSILVNGPTSGGKTFASMAAIDWLINDNGNIKLLYCAPLDHLCIQAWANISKSFKQKVALVCGVFSYIPDDACIWIGTPIEINSYLRGCDQTFTIGIFDEIHSLSTSFGNGMLNIIRSEAISVLLTRIEKQIVAISATIHKEDIPILKRFISFQTKITPIHEIIYTERPIPVIHEIYNPDNEKIPVIPESTFQLIRSMKAQNIFPALIFDESDESCYTHFSSYVDWLDMKESTECWSVVYTTFEPKITSLNDEMRIYEADSLKNDSSRKALLPRIRGFIKRKMEIIHDIRSTLRSLIEKYLIGDYIIQLPISERSKFPIRDVNEVSSLSYYLFQQYMLFPQSSVTEDSTDALSPLMYPCQGKAPFYCVGEYIPEVKLFKTMYNKEKCSGESRKLRKRMLELCRAERIREREIKPLFNLITRGLEYGIGIILPTMPFVVQYLVLQLLSERRIKVVFASHSMSMGINFPIRSVVIRSNDLIDLNVCEFMQMSGRAGRRGLDTKGYVISWNISNAMNASISNLPRIVLPNTDGGFLIQDALKCAVNIECKRVNINDTSLIDDAINNLSIENSTEEIEEAKVTGYDENGDEIYEINKSKIIRSNINDQSLASSIIGCIAPVMKSLNMGPIMIIEITKRIQDITLGQYSSELSEDNYYWSQAINMVKCGLQEVHAQIRNRSNEKLIKYIACIYELLHRVQYRQMRM